ncbi:NmrA/HSCARG family protein [Micromonospora rubida]|uniref:NmrA/HSCARG family protein n=1 Tax=Micromonospora rubida TaxID=2697657 RepID=UPI0013784835|nr:NmrA/HSCARG family protein [Micromonospora rubida]NBE85219.1 NmrA family NAD(P)-binding protein [Micromonospora rubida]
MSKPILVTGATGKQGGATARHLLAQGWQVRALVRDPEAPAATALRRAGARLVAGDLNDRTALDAAVAGAYGVFSVQAINLATPDMEAQQGINVAEAAAAAGAAHLVYTSVGGVERHEAGAGAHDRKRQIEQHIERLGIPATILRPVTFMENWASPGYVPGLPDGRLGTALRPEVPMQLIAAEDIGMFATLALTHPDEYAGRAIELAGDALTAPQIAAAVSKATGREVTYVHLPYEDLHPLLAWGFRWYNEEGYRADIPALRASHPELMTFEAWLDRSGTRMYKQVFEGLDG